MGKWKAAILQYRAAAGLVAIAIVAVITITGPAVASAAAPSPSKQVGNALKISPVRQDFVIKPGETKTFNVYVQNLTDSPADLHGIINDFTSGQDESGTPSILLNENSYAPSHGLKRYTTTVGSLTLQPKEQKSVAVTIKIPANAAGGGYYGAVRFVPVSGGASGKNVSLSASVGSLVLVTVPGNITEQLGVASFNVRGSGQGAKASTLFTSGAGLTAVSRFKNGGNVQVSPFGKITLKRFGKELGSYEINNTDPRGSVLPDSIRRFETALDNTTQFGKYTIEGNFGYGTSGKLITARTSFYVVPWWLIGLVGGVLLLIVLAVFAPRLLREHDRRLLSRGPRRR